MMLSKEVEKELRRQPAEEENGSPRISHQFTSQLQADIY
jgi:hypothetical protein